MPEAHPDGTLSGLLRRAVDGDTTAREELLEKLYVPLRRYARRHLSGWIEPDEAAKDVAQDTLVRITAHLGACRAQSDRQLVAWALAILRNVIIDRARQRAEECLVRFGPAVEPLAVTPPPDDPPSSADRTLSRLVRSALDALPPEKMRLLQLRLQLGDRWADVGAELGTSWSAARRRFQRLQSTLRKDIARRIESLPQEDREVLERRLPRLPEPRKQR